MPPITVTPEQLLMYYKRYFTAMEDPESTESIREYHYSNLQYALAIFLADRPHNMITDHGDTTKDGRSVTV